MIVTTRHIFDEFERVEIWDILPNAETYDIPGRPCYDGPVHKGQLHYYGNVDLRKNTDITHLPDNLEVNGYLDISYTKITKLPKNLTVHGDLYIRALNIETTRLDTYIHGHLVK